MAINKEHIVSNDEAQLNSIREKQIAQYIPLVKFVIGRYFATVPAHVDREDMLQAGLVGLIQAVDQFDPDRSVQFKNYAIPRIRGAILDSFREADWAPRSVRQKTMVIEKAICGLEADLGRSPMESEVAEKLGISLEEYQSQLDDANSLRVYSLQHPFWQSEDGASYEPPDTDEDHFADEKIDPDELQTIIYKTLGELPDRERLILILYYYENLTFKEIAVVLGIT